MKNNILALAAGAIGGLIGYLGFFWIVRQGFYALVLPGGLIGLGASLFKSRSTAICIACGATALALGLVTEWQFAPFAKDDSLAYFVTHLYQLRPITLIMVAVGTALGFWLPFQHRHDGAAAAGQPG